MRGKVVEISASGNVGLYTPRHNSSRASVKFAGRLCQTNLYVDDLSYARYQLLNLLEIGEIATVISYEAGNTHLLACFIDADAVFVSRSHGLLYVYRLAGFDGHDGIGGVR